MYIVKDCVRHHIEVSGCSTSNQIPFFPRNPEPAHIFEMRDLRLNLTNQCTDDIWIPWYWENLPQLAAISTFNVSVSIRRVEPGLPANFFIIIKYTKWLYTVKQSVFSDYVHAQTPKRVSGQAKPRSAPNIITDFSLLFHPCLPNSTSYNLCSSDLKENHCNGVNPFLKGNKTAGDPQSPLACHTCI